MKEKKEEEKKKLNNKMTKQNTLNEIQKIETEVVKTKVVKTDLKHKINNDKEYYKLYMNLRKTIFEYIKNRYTELNQKDKTKVSDEELKFLNYNFEKNAEEYFQKIAEKYLPKPMVFIKYVFLIFKKQPYGRLTPMIFNVKELKLDHKPILERVEKLIKHELPYRFGILSDNEYNNREGNEKDPFDDEYKLFYSRYRYGKFFHITTEYVHTMNNISDKAHGYKNSITLEELIYACGLHNDLGKSFFEDLKIEYEVREHQINNYVMIQSKIKNKEKNNKNEKNRSEIVFDLYLYEKSIKQKIVNNNKGEVVLQNKKLHTNLQSKNIKFILIFISSVQTYTFIYSLDGFFYKLVIESNMKNIIGEIIKELNTTVSSNNSNTIKFKNPTKLFKIVNNNILDIEDYKNIFKYNPFIVNKIKQIPQKIDISYYYETALLTHKQKIGTFANLYTEIKPYRYTNHIIGEQYIKGFYNYIDNLNNNQPVNLDCNTLNFEHKFTDCELRNCYPNEVIINCAYYNIGNSGYDIIESIDNSDNKIVLYIVPHNFNYNYNESPNNLLPIYKNKYLGNFLDLDFTSLPILYEIKNKYSNNDYLCFLHHTITLRYYCLHFHIIKKEYYKRNYPKKDVGTFMIQDMFIDEIINNLKSNKNYYKIINYNIIKTT